MAEASGIDVLMRVSVTGGSLAMEAESLADFAPLDEADPMVSDFKTGHFCELREFDFSAGAENSMNKTAAATAKTAQPAPAAAAGAQRKTGAHVAQVMAKLEERAAIERGFRDRIERRERGDFVDMREVSYTRIMDSASPLLFKALTDCTTLKTITVVKRKAAGATVSGLGYLRLDFEDVLLTQLDWKDSEHIMVESGTFIYRKLTIKYLSQKADGSLIPGSSATWKMKAQRTGS